MFASRVFNRYYNDYYLPLGTHPTKRPSRRTILMAGLFVASLVFNLVIVIRHFYRWTSPLDDYQEL